MSEIDEILNQIQKAKRKAYREKKKAESPERRKRYFKERYKAKYSQEHKPQHKIDAVVTKAETERALMEFKGKEKRKAEIIESYEKYIRAYDKAMRRVKDEQRRLQKDICEKPQTVAV